MSVAGCRSWSEATPQCLGEVGRSAPSAEIAEQGRFLIPNLMTADECRELSSVFVKDKIFGRTTLVEQTRLGLAEVRYSSETPIEPVASLRNDFFQQLPPITQLSAAVKIGKRYPGDLFDHSAHIRRIGKARPPSSLSRSVERDYGGMSQDVEGGVEFPLQAAALLSRPNKGFDGGEFAMTEQRPRMQSRPLALSMQQGDAVVFATRYRPVTGAGGAYRVNLRQGVSSGRADCAEHRNPRRRIAGRKFLGGKVAFDRSK
jgi:uncharacterized protein